jgi:hypothetical protein
MERTARRFRTHEEAAEADLLELLALTPEARQEISRALRERWFGSDCVDIKRSGEARLVRR